jgi:hypothetical protein
MIRITTGNIINQAPDSNGDLFIELYGATKLTILWVDNATNLVINNSTIYVATGSFNFCILVFGNGIDTINERINFKGTGEMGYIIERLQQE